MEEKKLNRFIYLLYFLGVLGLFFVITCTPVSAETLTRNLDANAKIWVSNVDTEDILRVPTNGYNIIQNTDNEGFYIYSWGPSALYGYNNPIRYNTDLLYSAYVSSGSNCSNNCDLPILFNIVWQAREVAGSSSQEERFQYKIAWILNQYNHVYINFTDNNNRTWHTKLSTRVLSATQTTEQSGSNTYNVYNLNIAYSLTLYNVSTINYIDINVPNPESDYSNAPTTTFVNLLTKTFAYSYMSYSGGSNGIDGSDQSSEEIQQLQQQTNEKLQEIKLQILSEEQPNTMGLGGSAGWLPAGPVDSIINLPLTFFQGLNNAMSTSCSPVNVPLPFVNQSVQLPCVNTLFNQINGFSTWWNAMGLIATAFILYKYLIHLYQWVDNTLTFRENNWQDWGGI